MTALASRGLNLVAVFDLAALPGGVRDRLAGAVTDIEQFRQVLLIAHGGLRFWSALQEAGMQGDDPVDSFSTHVVADWFSSVLPGVRTEILYPLTDSPVPLVELGTLAGWHYASPFRVGINDAFGSWFAYRALVLADSDLPATPAMAGSNPCDGCVTQPCIRACPAGAVHKEKFDASACYDHRLTSGSNCASTCMARAACPVAREHTYSPSQTAYHYERSLISLRRYREEGVI